MSKSTIFPFLLTVTLASVPSACCGLHLFRRVGWLLAQDSDEEADMDASLLQKIGEGSDASMGDLQNPKALLAETAKLGK